MVIAGFIISWVLQALAAPLIEAMSKKKADAVKPAEGAKKSNTLAVQDTDSIETMRIVMGVSQNDDQYILSSAYRRRRATGLMVKTLAALPPARACQCHVTLRTSCSMVMS